MARQSLTDPCLLEKEPVKHQDGFISRGARGG